MKLPTELICKIIREVINTPAVFIFDVVRGNLKHSAGGPNTYHCMAFEPRVSPPGNQIDQQYPGTFESQVSKTIRSLLLTNKSIRAECLKQLQGIAVPTANGQAVVRFNPRKHVICIHRVKYNNPAVLKTHDRFEVSPYNINLYARQLADLNFDIDSLGFIADPECGDYSTLALFRSAFPTLKHIYAVVTEFPRKNPSEPIDFVCPSRDPTHSLSPVFLHIAKRSWEMLAKNLFYRVYGVHTGGDWEQESEIDGLVLI
ncbi:hypothetical protein UCDDA912_g06503 [Diaporthe ampelina]|uniref:Uncharacterized protein n=1 Tax=Diaporthe ampelina TaxID=1214573 RepID=A0A0G2FHD4_9PEZI|nr:hypothetical protein UCDDA912_g06503 [Diaporthe ampelina]